MFSFRSDKSQNRNINNLMFITGPDLAGKSWLLNYNLEKFKYASMEVSPFLFHLDLKTRNSWSFQGFLDAFECGIID